MSREELRSLVGPRLSASVIAPSMSLEELLSLPVTTDVETAGRACGIGRALSYEMASRGEFPVKILRLGCRYKVLTSDLLRVLGVSAASSDRASQGADNDAT